MDIVLKFGGTSLGTPEALKRSAAIVVDAARAGYRSIVVVSALANERGRATEKLLAGDYAWVVGEYWALAEALGVSHPSALINELEHFVGHLRLQPHVSTALRDEVVSFGERLMAVVFVSYLRLIEVDARPVDARDIVVAAADGMVSLDATRANIAVRFRDYSFVSVVTGFIARTPEGQTVTIGRGGSDLTAVLLAIGLDLLTVELWTDVCGIMTADPRIVDAARPIDAMSYDEALEAVRAGAKGIPPEAVRLAQQHNVVITVKSLSDPEASGTRIGVSLFCLSRRAPKLVAHSGRSALLTVRSASFAGVAGTIARMTNVLAERGVNLDMLTQAMPEHSIVFVVDERDARVAHDALVALFANESVVVREPVPCSVVTVVGESMSGGVGISGRLYTSISRAGVNVLSSAQAEEDAISVVCRRDDGPAALRAAHAEFFEHTGAPAIFLLGVGNVGGALLEQMGDALFVRGVHLCGVANSTRMAVVPQGIVPKRACELLGADAEEFNLDAFVAHAKRVPASQRIIVDCTPSEEIARYYSELFHQGFDVIAANKLANSAPSDDYLVMRAALRNSGRSFRDSANVGGKLGVIPVLRRYAPVVTRVEALLSGTLGWLFSHYDGTKPFVELVEEARALGLTEPDPKLDLSGEDVARKLLILLRKFGVRCDEHTILNVRSNVEDLSWRDELYFSERFVSAQKSGFVLRYVAHFEPGGNVGADLVAVGPHSPFFSAKDAENVVVIHTTTEPPIVIRGPGAGPVATAEAVLLDIIELLNQ